jgi:hypothetical protein
MFRILVLALSIVASAAATYAADLNSVALRGDISYMDLVYQNGIYQHSQLGLWADDTATQLQPLLVHCNGNASGLSACSAPATLLPCLRTQTTINDPFVTGRVTQRYTCTLPARRDAGACVNVLAQVGIHDIYLYSVYSARDSRLVEIQAAAPDVQQIAVVPGGWGPPADDCTSKP